MPSASWKRKQTMVRGPFACVESADTHNGMVNTGTGRIRRETLNLSFEIDCVCVSLRCVCLHRGWVVPTRS